MIDEILIQSLAFFTGILLGAFFFIGLWWTVHYGMRSTWPGPLFIVSLLVRSGVVLFGFYFVSQGHWERIVASVLGFVVARFIVRRLIAVWEKWKSRKSTEARHAS